MRPNLVKAALNNLGMLVCILLVCGCTFSSRPTTQASSIPSASEEILFVGMDLGDALEMLTRHGIYF